MMKRVMSHPRLGQRYISYIPAHETVIDSDLAKLHASKVVVLTGAGVSTESVIPDYRSEGVGLYARSNHSPIQHQVFMSHTRVHHSEYQENIILMIRRYNSGTFDA